MFELRTCDWLRLPVLGCTLLAITQTTAPKNFPANTLPELIAYVKANQNTVKYGSAGAGTASHVSCILLNAALGIDIVHIPYRGLGPAMQDLIADRIIELAKAGERNPDLL